MDPKECKKDRISVKFLRNRICVRGRREWIGYITLIQWFKNVHSNSSLWWAELTRLRNLRDLKKPDVIYNSSQSNCIQQCVTSESRTLILHMLFCTVWQLGLPNKLYSLLKCQSHLPLLPCDLKWQFPNFLYSIHL